MADSTALDVRNIAKRYGATVALDDVSLQIESGEIHAILGENGAGKSTLVKILSGVVQPDRGSIQLGAEPFAPRALMQARALGVSTAFQELSLLPNLSVAENLLLPKLPRGPLGITSRRATNRKAHDILQQYGISDIDPSLQVESLYLAEKQRIEIVRALLHARRLLVLDEPSSALADTNWLFSQVRQAADRGVAVMYISHRLGEVRSLCSRATVLRNGRSIDSVELAGVDDTRIFEMMVGRSPESLNTAQGRADSQLGEIVLEARDLTAGKVKGTNFSLHQGEILGVAALEGQGQRDLFRVLVGLLPVESGEVRVSGKAVRPRSPRHALSLGPGIAYVPEERKVEGIFGGLKAATNVSLPRTFALSRYGYLSHRIERKAVKDSAARVELQPRYLGFRINALSGGNQQKAVIARALETGAGILVMFDPTRGVDVGTKQAIYKVIREFASQGGSVLVYSSELPELTQLSDRCLVFYGGQVTEVLATPDITESALISGIVGHRTGRDAAENEQQEVVAS